MNPPARAYVATWSGGKDSCLACYTSTRQGSTIAHLANFVSEEYGRVRFHGVTTALIRAQAKAIGLPLLQNETAADHYEADFKHGIASLRTDNISGLVFGDIHLERCREWAENVCQELGLQLVEPLWGRSTEEVLLDFIEGGFRGVVVSTQADVLDEEWVGRQIDRAFLRDLKSIGNVDLCGENGEYHTFVFDGPLFQQRVVILETRKVLRDGFWFLDIKSYALSPKLVQSRGKG